MFEISLITISILLSAAGVGLYLYAQTRKRRTSITKLVSGTSLLAHWTYTQAEWRKVVKDEFTWEASKDYAGEVYISSNRLCVRADHRDRLIELAGKRRVVTHASYKGADESPLKLRVRWREVTHDEDGAREVDYLKEDYRIPVPPWAKDLASKVVDFFNAQMENDPDAYASVVSEDDPISIFVDDSF